MMHRLSLSIGTGVILVSLGYALSSCGAGPTLKTTDPDKGAFAIQFPGITSIGFYNFIDADKGEIMIDSPITIEAMIKTTATGTIFVRSSLGGGIALYLDGTGTLTFDVGSDSATTTLPVVNDGSWHHVAGVLAGVLHTHATSTAATASVCSDAARSGIHADLYIDGNWITCAGPTSYPAEIDCANCKNYIGREAADDDTPIFTGVIDEVRLWKVARDKSVELGGGQNLISIWKGEELARTGRNGLVGYWQFNEGAGDTAIDSSGVGDNGIKQYCTGDCSSDNETTARWDSGWVAGYPF